VTTLQSVDTSEGTVEETEDQESISSEELFEAEPSEIDEVFVKVTGEQIETNLITTSTSKPEKYAPRFCLKLKFNCKLRSAHPCCRYPLPPRDDNQASTTAATNIGKIKVRPTRRQNTPEADTEGTNSLRKSPFRRPLKRQPVRIINKSKNKVSDNQGELTSYSININSQNNERKTPSKGVSGRPSFRPASKLALNTVRRRPDYSLGGKSPVCRIINCRRNKKHKCCQEPKETTTTETESDTVAPFDKTTIPEIINKAEEVRNKQNIVKSGLVSITSEETKMTQATSLDEEKPQNTTTDIVLSTTAEPLERVQNTVHEEDDQVTTLKYKAINTGVHTSQRIIDLEFETTTSKEERVEYTIEEETKMAFPMPIEDKEIMLEENFENQQVYNIGTEQSNTEQPEVKPDQGSQYKNTTEQSVVNNTTAKFWIKGNIEDKGQHLADDNSIETEITEQPAYLSSENTKQTKTKKGQQEQQFEDTSVFEDVASEYQAEELEYPDYDNFERIEGKRELVFPDYVISITDNHIDKEILDPNQILPRIAGQCFRFDCLSQPHHGCCSPHTAQKRQTGQDQTARVTKTVTRVLKTVSW